MLRQNTKRIDEIEASKEKALKIAKEILEQNRGNEKAIAAGQIALMEKTIAWLENNKDYFYVTNQHGNTIHTIWDTHCHENPSINDVRALLSAAVKEMAK